MTNPTDSPWLVFSLTGDLDLSSIDELDEMFGSVFDTAGVNATFDLSGVTFMDSSALRWFLKVQDRADLSTGELRLVAPPDGHFQRLLSLTGLDGRFSVFPGLIEAEEMPSDTTDDIDDLLATLSNHDARSAMRAALHDGDIWERATAAGYTEWTGLGHRLTDKGRARSDRITRR